MVRVILYLTSVMMNLEYKFDNKVKYKTDISIDYVPIIRTEKGIRLANDSEGKEIIENSLKDQKYWKKDIWKCSIVNLPKNLDNYLRSFSGFGRWFSWIDRYIFKGLLIKLIYRKNACITKLH